MSNAKPTRLWFYCKVLKMPTFTVWTEHHHAQYIRSISCDPNTLSTMAECHYLFKDISRRPRVTNIEQ